MSKTSLRIAFRYLFSRKSHSVVNVISAVTVAGVAVAVAAMVVVMSVFNGFNSLIASRLSELDPILKVELSSSPGKAFADADSLAALIESLPEITAATPTLEQRALAVIGQYQTPVRVKGVCINSYSNVAALDSVIIDGHPWHDFHQYAPPSVLSVGVANALRAPVGSSHLLHLYAPRRVGRINPANPTTAFRSDSASLSAVFAVNQPEFDADMVYVPIGLARKLFQFSTEATAIEVETTPGTDIGDAIAAIAGLIGPEYTVLDRMEQHKSSFRIVNVEKWMSFLLLAFILLIASFNVISTMTLLIIEKEPNAYTLKALGASSGFIRSIYSFQSVFITMAGALAGALAGSLLSLGQQSFGWVKLAADPASLSLSAYPVEFHAADLIPILLTAAIIGSATAVITPCLTTRR
ncbi:MAG: ABC transporter permease [Muribaculaceae bacterium]|nr:ABC transporter permease [Muribaculaceae bacterium]